jgi:hypothetical protein
MQAAVRGSLACDARTTAAPKISRISAREARVFCYFDIASVVGLSLYMYLKLARMIGSRHLN